MNRNNEVVTLTRMVNGGYGLARSGSGGTVLVRRGLPGETVRIEISERKKGLAFAQVIEVLAPAPGRVEPPCPYYGRCGGCSLQHADYRSQCRLKGDIIAELLGGGRARHDGAAAPLAPLLEAPAPFGYRQRIRLKIDGRGRPGFNHFRSNQIVPVERCLLAAEPINRCLAQLPDSPAFAGLAGPAEEVELILNPRTGRVALLFSQPRSPRPAEVQLARALAASVEPVDRVFFCGRRFALQGPYGDDEASLDRMLGLVIDGDPPLAMGWEVGGFSQVNPGQNRRLIALVERLAAVEAGDRVLDLYCGMGNFSIPLARAAGQVVGIESQASAIRSAIANAAGNGLDNCRFSKGDAAEGCRRLAAAGERFEVLVCDPPRRGLAALAEGAAALVRRRLIYISCDPATLVRDLKTLTGLGLALELIQPLDMFPQTHHIETVAVLEKR